MNQVGKIKQITEFLTFIFFNIRSVYVDIKVTYYYKVS